METQKLRFVREQQYEILLGCDIIPEIVGKFARMGFHKRCCLLTNEVVAKWYLDPVMQELTKRHFEVLPLVLPDGECSKTLETVNGLYPRLVEFQLDRRSPLMTLGGGVIGDMGGFLAATFQRGVPYIQVPTTLLAQVDACIGGKVAVNLPTGKNLVGSFYQPSLVGIDIATLKTLPLTQLSYGVVESIKHGAIADAAYFKFIHKNRQGIKEKDLSLLQRLVRRSLNIKKSFVEEDELEKGKRACLNFGHTFGHALEVIGEYRRFHHGEAVGLGMLMAIEAARELDLLREDYREGLVEFLRDFNLPTTIPKEISEETLLKAMIADKKRDADKLALVLPVTLGKVEIVSQPISELSSLLRSVLSSLY